jgi:hypothetical protein
MRARLRRLLSAPGSSRALVVVAAAAALVSALWGTRDSLQRMDAARDYYTSLSAAEREDEIELALGFDHALWERIQNAVDDDDRFAVVSEAPEQHEVRNYAAYALLPAIQVSDAQDANVVLYYASDPPAGAECDRLAADVCLERRTS